MDLEEGLRLAAQKGDDISVIKYLSEGVKQTEDENGDTPLLMATTCYITEPTYVNIVRRLMNAGGMDINHRNREGNAAIHNAAFRGSLEIVELLLDNGADIELEGELMMVPLGLAATKKHHAVVNALVKKLVEENKFSRKQVEWIKNAENEQQQMSIFRALASIFQQKAALKSLIQFDVVSEIFRGIKRFNKKLSVLTSGLQLLQTCLNDDEGLQTAKDLNLDKDLIAACKDYQTDAVVQHMLTEVKSKLS